jgi:hemerythrin-like metal-binding protein
MSIAIRPWVPIWSTAANLISSFPAHAPIESEESIPAPGEQECGDCPACSAQAPMGRCVWSTLAKGNLPMLLMWTENLSVSVKNFDDDHKRLIRMINELHGAIEDVDAEGKIAEEEIEIALHRLENYFQYHCLREEEMLAKTGYAGLEEHQQEHQKFFATVAEMARRFRGSRDPRHATELMQFMFDWLSDHIFVTDRKYTLHLNAKGIT